jgi:hypothetical protein
MCAVYFDGLAGNFDGADHKIQDFGWVIPDRTLIDTTRGTDE